MENYNSIFRKNIQQNLRQKGPFQKNQNKFLPEVCNE